VSIAANKIDGIRCGLAPDVYTARMIREHNDGNVLALGNRTTGIEVGKEIVDAFLSASFSPEEKHHIRVNKITALESSRNAKSC